MEQSDGSAWIARNKRGGSKKYSANLNTLKVKNGTALHDQRTYINGKKSGPIADVSSNVVEMGP